MDFRELADLPHFQCIPKQRHEKLCKNLQEATSDKLQVPNGSKGFAVAISLVLCASALKLLCAEA